MKIVIYFFEGGWVFSISDDCLEICLRFFIENFIGMIIDNY